jgi:hypothetical protein
MNNAAFQDGNGGIELARILREYADKAEGACCPKHFKDTNLMDINGNIVGVGTITSL